MGHSHKFPIENGHFLTQAPLTPGTAPNRPNYIEKMGSRNSSIEYKDWEEKPHGEKEEHYIGGGGASNAEDSDDIGAEESDDYDNLEGTGILVTEGPAPDPFEEPRAWPFAVGQCGKAVKAWIEEERGTHFTVEIIRPGDVVENSHNLNRVRVIVNEKGFVVEVPRAG